MTSASSPPPRRRGWNPRPLERRILLFLGDALAAWLAWLLANGVWMWVAPGVYPPRTWLPFLLSRPTWFYFLPFVWQALLVELYNDARANHWEETRRGLVAALALALLGYLGLYVYLADIPGPPLLPRVSVAAFLGLAAVTTGLWRAVYVFVFLRRVFIRRAIIVGAGRHGQDLLRLLTSLNPPPFTLLGFVDDDPAKQGETIGDLPVFGPSHRLPELVDPLAVTDVVVAVQGTISGRLFQALLELQARGVAVSHMNAVYEEVLQRVPIAYLDATWMTRAFIDEARKTVYYEALKRLLDIIGGLVGLALFLILTPFLALLIYLDSGLPIFFSQQRVGLHGRVFRVWKFRTMRPDRRREQGRWAREDQDRITRLGRFLRRTHLDEIPQFWNVLLGHMSLVGPRPEQPEIVDMLEKRIPFYRARLLVKPGLTGWAQVNMGYVSTLEETRIKLEYDLFYIKHRNLFFDLYIILRTFGAVLGARGG